MLLSQSRGKESSGIAVIKENSIDVLKRPVRASILLRHPEFKAMMARIDSDGQSLPFAVIGHARMVTNGSAHEHQNNQPVITQDHLCVHNGIFVQSEEIWARYPSLTRQFQVDTEAYILLVDYFSRQGDSYSLSSLKALQELEGGNSVVLVRNHDKRLLLSSANGSMYIAKSGTGNELIFSSERSILVEALSQFQALLPIAGIVNLNNYETLDVSLDCNFNETPTLTAEEIRTASSENVQVRLGEQLLSPSANTDTSAITDHCPIKTEVHLYRNPLAGVVSKNLSAQERLLEIDFERIKQLRRCSRCVLPETFPFIRFSSSGVCNYCENYAYPEVKGIAELKEQLASMPRKDKRGLRCLIPISGGRDSCYGLHYVREELGLNPVAYTYDWGMVTDLARRNISRMCGKLNVEHVLISADIKGKRANVRKNVEAWLKRPHLGLVPLFMAGDKQFFYYANLLKKQMNLDLILYSINPYERTDFKVGFCGIDENFKKEHYYNLGGSSKVKMAFFYAKEFIRNPSYLNTSMLDTIFAFFSYYMIPRDYKSLFDYLQWDEKVVEGVLLSDYNWETSPDTPTTWRIGDGTASFYNYIYTRVAGFSENDTMKSNLIRIGQNNREEALATVYLDNAPRFESIRWYCDTIGLDYNETIRTVNSMPKFY
jgi:glutamine---fructose-6-phosphate transaminase (isomerizing)